MTRQLPAITALVYDFDGTLAPGNMQEHSFIPELGMDKGAFWQAVKEAAKKHDADEVSTYMWRMLELSKAKGRAVTESALRKHGKELPLFRGLDTWFERITKYGLARNLTIEHYVISSGIYEIIAGCSIFGRFKKVFASKFIYDEHGNAVWPGLAINYTTKTQFLFRINKGIENSWDIQMINRWIPLDERRIPFERVVFIGDGDTDIPSMKMIRHQGGHSIAVFDPKKENAAEGIYRLISEDRVHFVAPADYQAGSQLDTTVKGILGRVAREAGYRETMT